MSGEQSPKLFSRTLFVNDNGVALRFHIRPCSEKPKLRKIIEERGGIIADRPETDVFRLVLPNDHPPVHTTRNLRVQFIYDCMSQNLLLPTTQYRIVTKTDAELDDELDIENIHEDDLAYCIRTRMKETKSRKEYRPKDDTKIIRYVIKKNCYSDVKGRAIWVKMEEDFGERTWQSLKERYLKRIVPNLHNYDLPDEVYKKIKVGCGMWTQRDANRLNSRKKIKERRIISSGESSAESDATIEFNPDSYNPNTKDHAKTTADTEPEIVFDEIHTSKFSGQPLVANSENLLAAQNSTLQNRSHHTISSVNLSPRIYIEKLKIGDNEKLTDNKSIEHPIKNSTDISTTKATSPITYVEPEISLNINSELHVNYESNTQKLTPRSSLRLSTLKRPSLNLESPPSKKLHAKTSVEASEALPEMSRKSNSPVLLQTISHQPFNARNHENLPETSKYFTPPACTRSNTFVNINNKNTPEKLHNSSSEIDTKIISQDECEVSSEKNTVKVLCAVDLVAANACQEMSDSQNTEYSISLLDEAAPVCPNRIERVPVSNQLSDRNIAVQTDEDLQLSGRSSEDDDDVDSLDIQLLEDVKNNNARGPNFQSHVQRSSNKPESPKLGITNMESSLEQSLSALPLLDTLTPDIGSTQLPIVEEISQSQMCITKKIKQIAGSFSNIGNCLKALEAKSIKGRRLVPANDGDVLISRNALANCMMYVRNGGELTSSVLQDVEIKSIMRKPLSELSKQDDQILKLYISNQKPG